MENIIVKGNILKKDLSVIYYEEIIIKMKGLDGNYNMIYSYTLPKHIYDNLVDTEIGFQSYKNYIIRKKKEGDNFKYSETYLKKTIESNSIPTILDTIGEYSTIIFNILHKKELVKIKKIFVRFGESSSHSKCSWTGGYMGKRISSNFQFFIGYEIEEPDRNLLIDLSGAKPKFKKNYYTLIRYATGTLAKHDTGFKEGNKLEPLYMSQDRQEFLDTYKIINWTQEAEDYLNMVQDKLINVNSQLNKFLGELDEDKIQNLILNNGLNKLLA